MEEIEYAVNVNVRYIMIFVILYFIIYIYIIYIMRIPFIIMANYPLISISLLYTLHIFTSTIKYTSPHYLTYQQFSYSPQ